MSLNDNKPATVGTNPFTAETGFYGHAATMVQTVPLSAYTALAATYKALVLACGVVDAERDRAIRQRDHARGWASFFRSRMTYDAATYNPKPAPLSDADEDGWAP